MTAQEFAAKYMGKQVRTNPNCGNIYGVVVRADGNFVYIKTSRSDADGWYRYPDNLRPVEDEQPTAPLTAREIATKYAGCVATGKRYYGESQDITGRITGYTKDETFVIVEGAPGNRCLHGHEFNTPDWCMTVTDGTARSGHFVIPSSIVIHNTQPSAPKPAESPLSKALHSDATYSKPAPDLPAPLSKALHSDATYSKPAPDLPALLTRAISIINGVNWDRQTKADYEQARALVRDIAGALGKK